MLSERFVEHRLDKLGVHHVVDHLVDAVPVGPAHVCDPDRVQRHAAPSASSFADPGVIEAGGEMGVPSSCEGHAVLFPLEGARPGSGARAGRLATVAWDGRGESPVASLQRHVPSCR